MKNNDKIGAFTKFCCTIGNLPSSYMQSMTYEEQLIWLSNYLEKTIVPTLQQEGEAIIELQEYIKNYFDNLDVQEEINNKLDDMAESGELTEIIAQYLQLAGILAYNTLDDLENAENIVEGSFTKTYGKITYNDGYGAFYKIRALINTDVVDGENLVALTNYPTLVAEKMKDENIEYLLQTVETLQNTITSLNNFKDEIESNNRYLTNFRFYIDGVNGDDENDGLTQETAFKTLDRFLEEANTRSDIRCYIISDGTYTIEKPVVAHTTIHISANTNNVIIDTSDEFTFYNFHLNIENLTFRYTSNNVPHMETGSFVVNNCVIPQAIRFYDCMVSILDSTINEMRFDNCRLYMNNITIDGKAKSNYSTPLSIVRASVGELSGTFKYEALTESNVTNILNVYGGNVNFHGSFDFTEQTGQTYNYSSLNLNYCNFFTTATNYYSIIDKYTITGSYYEFGSIPINDTDINLTYGSLSKDNSYTNGRTINLDIDITGITTSANTTLIIGTIAEHLRPSQNVNLIAFNNDYTPMFGWISSNGNINIRTKDAMSNKEIRISANYIK